MKTYRLTLCYDGSRYRGWQRQGNTGGTIQAKVEETLGRILEQEVEAAGSGRTDAGAHARRQTASFRADTALSCGEILDRLRQYLPEDIGALALEEAPPRFHARLNCRRKTYLYRLWNSDIPCVFERKYVWQIPGALDTAAMARAAERLQGEHDFSAFRSGHSGKSPVRRLDSLLIERAGEELRLWFTGDGFLYNMVRILTGTLVGVGRGQRTPESMDALLDGRNRAAAGPVAPARGLCLWDQEY